MEAGDGGGRKEGDAARRPEKDESSDRVEILATEAETQTEGAQGEEETSPVSSRDPSPSATSAEGFDPVLAAPGEDLASDSSTSSSTVTGWKKQSQGHGNANNPNDVRPRPRSVFFTREQVQRSASSGGLAVRTQIDNSADALGDPPRQPRNRGFVLGSSSASSAATPSASSSVTSSVIKEQVFLASRDFGHTPSERSSAFKNQSEPTWVIQGKAAIFANFSSLHALVCPSFLSSLPLSIGFDRL